MSAGATSGEQATLAAALQAVVAARLPDTPGIEGLRRLSAGATLQTWAFDAVGATSRRPLILRRVPGGGPRGYDALTLPTEAELLRALARQGAAVPPVVHTLAPDEGAGEGFVMTRIEGETIPRRILRDADFAAARPQLAAQFGAALGRIHRADPALLPALPSRDAAQLLAEMRSRCAELDAPRPVFELALRWLDDHCPPPGETTLVHGDFRHGNAIVGAEGLRAVLDWELAHWGDPHEDLAWICLPPWRFGELDQPVGGFGAREPFHRAWEETTGRRVDRQRLHFWAVAGSLRWGLGCAGMLRWFRSGRDRSVERAMIARRASENEMDLMRLFAHGEA